FLRGVLQVPLHLSKRFVYHLQGVCPLLRVEMGRTGSVPHPPVRQLCEVHGETCSSRGILTEAFQRRESGNVERGSLVQFPRDTSKLTNFGNDFCRTGVLHASLSCSHGWCPRAYPHCGNAASSVSAMAS